MKKSGKEVPVYIYALGGDSHGRVANYFLVELQKDDIPAEVFNLGADTDYYSLPNIVQTMRTNRYSLVDEIYTAKLLTLKDVMEVK